MSLNEKMLVILWGLFALYAWTGIFLCADKALFLLAGSLAGIVCALVTLLALTVDFRHTPHQ